MTQPVKTKAVRLYGKMNLRLEEFELPPMGRDEILARVVSDSICMSSYKAAKQGANHKRVPADVAIRPVIIGHEFCGDILKVGAKWREQFQPGTKFTVQPALNYKGSLDAPGYSYRYLGGNATHVIIPNEVMACDCLLPYRGEGYFPGSLSEPVSCIVGAFHASYHAAPGSYVHQMGIRQNGSMAILGGTGPMGLAAIDYILQCDRRPAVLVVTDIDESRLQRAQTLFPPGYAAERGIALHYINTSQNSSPSRSLLPLSRNSGFDDVFVFAPVRQLVELGDSLLGRDGCLNFFAGPSNPEFQAELNFYRVHYAATHLVGTSGGNTDDMRESLDLIAAGRVNPSVLITHVGGLNAVIPTTLNLPEIPGGKKLIYTNINMELTALDDFPKLGKSDARFEELAAITAKTGGLWTVEAESFLLNHF